MSEAGRTEYRGYLSRATTEAGFTFTGRVFALVGTDHTGDLAYETEIALVKLESPLDERTQILQVAEHFKARVVDFGPESLILQAHGSSDKLDALIDLLRPFRIAELVRSGKLLMARGKRIT